MEDNNKVLKQKIANRIKEALSTNESKAVLEELLGWGKTQIDTSRPESLSQKGTFGNWFGKKSSPERQPGSISDLSKGEKNAYTSSAIDFDIKDLSKMISMLSKVRNDPGQLYSKAREVYDAARSLLRSARGFRDKRLYESEEINEKKDNKKK